MTRAIHTFRIRRLLSRIHSTLYSNGETFCSRTNSRQTAIQQLREEVENWYLEIPPTPAAKEPLTLFPTSDWFDLEYNYAIIQLYRSEIIHGPTGAGDDVFIQCMRASESICHGYRRQFVGKPTSSTWTALHELFLGGLTYLHCLWTSPAAREAHANGQVSSTCSDCTIALVIMAERWHAAAPYRDIFETLSNLTMKMMEEANGGISNFTLATTLHGRLVENDLMEQMELMGDSGISDGISELLDRLLGENPRED
ncbi:transcriptional activator protein acu-15 [Penicillium nucicola]|uniref:transcriptional activator protein acu-15 n=1 Tax=Penicillium nucicola TaxID=1850975 RepID=UPI002544E643|nr:transcriptional activator protein acu-15 [Penicillium nucicola]KAJ5747041.1 transcriptional activator protein acu-15 [Penicillium nucicola]